MDKKYIYVWNVMLNVKLQHMQSMLFQSPIYMKALLS